MRYSRTLISAISATLLVGLFAVIWPFVARPGQPTFADVGQWLSGVLQPIAILWFLVALIEQQRELRRQGDELARQSRLHHTSVFMDFFKSYDDYTERAFLEWMSRTLSTTKLTARHDILKHMFVLIQKVPKPHIDPAVIDEYNFAHHFTYQYKTGAAELVKTLGAQLSHLRQLAVLSNDPAAMERLVDVSFAATVFGAAQTALAEQQQLSNPPQGPE